MNFACVQNRSVKNNQENKVSDKLLYKEAFQLLEILP